ncbi:protein of unknown function [Pseudomonas sp. NFIX10]|uniref:DUF4276 family protein n=1 Tax=unclassified Pseudomonas TaxID=196821 RepID=UPI0008DFB956|nr:MULTISPECIES: DUF4276 family protein [unclassified Pseudomonas]SFB03724.1 protein of unknown function [Pseudomonas sp. NFIX10]SFE59786.1 protein of unknown function [Pseudomonas sp. NFACC06-1]
MKLYVEGGGDAASLKTACREGFSKFLDKAGFKGRMPRIVACGSRGDAFDSFCTAIRNQEPAMLLVDSEAPLPEFVQPGDAQQPDDRARWLPWQHLQQRQGDGWQKPVGSDDWQCHLMVQCMESWFLADRRTLKEFFGQGFQENQLPAPGNSVEYVPKVQVYDALAKATRGCKSKSQYGKGEHSFKLLGLIDPNKVCEASPWAKRFIESLERRR